MIPELERRAEVAKLATLLGADAGELAALEAVEAAALRDLRERVTELLFDGHLGAFRRAVHASGVMPVGISATIAEKAFGPLLCARLAGLVPTERAIGVAERLSTPFLAEVSLQMDPRRASDVIGGIPPARVRDIAVILTQKGQYVEMGRFVGHLTDESLALTVAALGEEDLLRIALMLDDPAGLDRAVSLLDPERLPAVLACAAAEDLWAEALVLASAVRKPQRRRFAAALVAGGDELVDSLVRSVVDQGLYDAVLPLVGALTPAGRARVLARTRALGVEQAHPELARALAA